MTSKLPILGIGVVAVLMICALGGVIIVTNDGDSGTDVATDVNYTAETATATSTSDASTDAQVRTATSADAVSVSDVQDNSGMMNNNSMSNYSGLLTKLYVVEGSGVKG